MATLAVITLAAVLVANAQQNPAPQEARQATPLSPTTALKLASARSAESDRRMADAVKLYREAAGAGSGEAAKRLGDIYWHGGPGIDRDLAESMRWYRVAEVAGVKLAQAVRLRP